MGGQLVAVAMEVGDQPIEQDHGETARRRDGQPLETFIHTYATLLEVA